MRVRMEMEASRHARWFERLLEGLSVQLWMGDAAKIRAKRVRKQRIDRLDAQHILKLMLKDDFPKIWAPSWANRDVRQLLWHRHRARYKKRLWREAERKQLVRQWLQTNM